MEKLTIWIEKQLFGFKYVVFAFIVLLTAFLAYNASLVRPSASFEKMIPVQHEYIQNYLNYKQELASLGNSVRVVIENEKGDIFNADFQERMRALNDELFFISGVDRSGMKSIWTSNVTWAEVTEDGFVGGTVIPSDYDGSQRTLDRLRRNVMLSGQVGYLVGDDFKSAVFLLPLMSINPDTGKPLDYNQLSNTLEDIRSKYEVDGVKVHITGFAKVVGDLIAGAAEVVIFFITAIIITFALLYLYSRCLRSTIVTVTCALVAVIWQLGLLNLLGQGLDPYSMLVPFLVFAIAVSHGVQLISSIGQHMAAGNKAEQAARLAFRSLAIPGLIALLSDGLGFITLNVIEIQVIQDLATAASVGVAVILLTNLVLLPILMSWTGVSPAGIKYLLAEQSKTPLIVTVFSRFADAKWAKSALIFGVVCLAVGLYQGQALKIGDLDAGAPELRADSRYNLDNAYVANNYQASTDIMVLMVETPAEQCSSYHTLNAVNQLQAHVEGIPGVQSTLSVATIAKKAIVGMNEGNPKWQGLSPNQLVLNAAVGRAPAAFMNNTCSMLPLIIYLDDHKANTLETVIADITAYTAANKTEGVNFALAAGNAGIEAATNSVIEKAQYQMLMWVYGVVGLLCFLTFRSVKTLICIILPLALTSILGQALMATLGIGVKVATLPVIALGVGIGVDYGIYIYSQLSARLKMGDNLQDAYKYALSSTGKAVAFTGVTLAIGVCTWVLSPIKFQADMGLMLTFMFIWNMIGALCFLPALAWLLNIGGNTQVVTPSQPTQIEVGKNNAV
ncbi:MULTISPECIES: RND family transporter [unclassified Moritella]|uniref:efflux RND transporter permease subunit n=1 Tax=unclassified Moritella TaxID=2637987 RepID=UPI001BACD081|nr:MULTISPECIES: MMPL family transporter [unclassified Moritella]QUM85367.1 MMPL family transporter [Moritella sp. 28]QUM89599.1 MMPL family transporter [Moritella sp. 36]